MKLMRPYKRIVFHNDPDKFIKSYEMIKVAFGVNPFWLYSSEDSKNHFSNASTILKNAIYVDDI